VLTPPIKETDTAGKERIGDLRMRMTKVVMNTAPSHVTAAHAILA